MLSWLVDTSQGIESDGWTWVLAALLTACWLASVRLARQAGKTGWLAIPMSLFGWMWLGFGLSYVARFWVLSVDSVTYGNFTTRLTAIPAGVVNASLLMTLVFWVASCGMYLLAMRGRGANPLASLAHVDRQGIARWTDALSLLAGAAVASQGLGAAVPSAFERPIGLVGSFWIVPATVAWMRCALPSGDRRPPRVRRWLYLVPGVLSFAFEPFRERLLQLFLVPFLTMSFAGRRVRLASALILALVFGVVGTVAVESYRKIAWSEYSRQEAAREIDVSGWFREPALSPWGAVLRRFHSFDSLLLTAHLMPNVLAFENRNVFADLLVETFVPRAFFPEKPQSARAKYFSRTIWRQGDPVGVEANIAPSMVGDLYSNGGIHWVLMGGLVWGILLGFLERWRKSLSPAGQAVILCYLALGIAGGLERDFSRAVATMLQGTLVLYLMILVLSGGSLWRKRPATGPHPSGRPLDADPGQAGMTSRKAAPGSASAPSGRVAPRNPSSRGRAGG